MEPKVLLMGEGQWSNVDVTLATEYAPTRWLDLVSELVTGYTFDHTHPNATK